MTLAIKSAPDRVVPDREKGLYCCVTAGRYPLSLLGHVVRRLRESHDAAAPGR
jgi:hypothetical protein